MHEENDRIEAATAMISDSAIREKIIEITRARGPEKSC
jgi:hypothetical protein